MGITIDDNVKKQLLNKLAEEPPMVISTAYAYAKNYVNYGEDITKAWTTAVQQASIIQKVRQKAWVEAYDSFHKDYEKRLKADMVAMLEILKQEINELCIDNPLAEYEEDMNRGIEKTADVIQQKINELKENEDGNK